MESINEGYVLKPYKIKKLQNFISKYVNFLKPEDFLIFIDESEWKNDRIRTIDTLIITKVEEFPKDKQFGYDKVRFLKKENYYFGDFIYRSLSTKENKILNKQGCRTLFLSLKYEQEKITKVYKELVSQLPLFELVVLDCSPEENEFVNKEFYEDNGFAYFEQFVCCECNMCRFDHRFGAVILDENKNLIYNREMFFESEEELELREFLISDLKKKPKEICLSKRVDNLRFWRKDEDKKVKAALYKINNDFTASLIAEYTHRKSDSNDID